MEAKELRIGFNYLFNGQSVTLTKQDLQIVLHFGGEYNYSPIPLTEDWLTKLGAIKLESDIIEYTVRFNYDGEYFEDCLIIYLDNENNWYIAAGRKILMPSVHVLQNFVFTNYGKELTINQ